MTTSPPPDVAKYLDTLPAPHRAALLKLRASVRSALPKGATERISYKVPAFEVDGRVVVWMAAFRDHLSFFGAHVGAEAARAMQKPGGPFVVKGSTIQFDAERGLPSAVVKRVVRARLAVVTPASAAKKTKKRPAARRPSRAKRTRAKTPRGRS